MKNLKVSKLPFSFFLFSTGCFSVPTFAQEVTGENQEYQGEIEETLLIGTRGKPRTVTDSPVAVDVFNAEALRRVSYADTNDILQTLVPSYSVGRQAIADGGTFIRTSSLRGMPTDKTLVLVNGKRRHRAALVQIGQSGSQGPDVATIPSSALKAVEVLRDGASSLYGSDAIAGVISFILKDNAEGVSFSVDTGQYYEGDGFNYIISGNVGFSLGGDGFFSLSGEISSSDFTERSEQYCEAFACVAENNPLYEPSDFFNDPTFAANLDSASLEGDVVQVWGQPNTDATRLFFNSGLPLGANTELYAFGSYSESSGDGSFFYRYPGNGTIEDLRNEDGSIYNPLEKFPGGFTPRFFGDVSDYSLVTGLRGESDRFTYDISARYGFDEISYTLKNTINPSLGAASPTSFKPGDLSNEETQLQGDFSLALSDAVTLAFGISYMEETYDVQQGEFSSYTAGPHATSDPFGFCDNGEATAQGQSVIENGSSLDCGAVDSEGNFTDPVYQVVGVGSNGFPGYSPEFSEVYERDSNALYAEISADLSEDFLVQSAVRYEDYSDFDAEVVGQIAAKYNFSDTFGIRASVGTGFRAPTPGQQGTTNVSTRLPNGFPVATGLFPAGGVVAQALGAEALQPETSTSFTLGFTGELGATSYTVDFYQIEIDDRTYAVSTLDVSSNEPDDPADEDYESDLAAYTNYLALVEANVVGAESIGGVFYFANAFDSKTSGLDIVTTTPFDWSNGSQTTLTVSLNYNQSEITSDASAFLNAEDQFDFENATPELRTVITANHTIDKLSFTARANYYGGYEDSNGTNADNESEPAFIQDYGAEIMFDLQASYTFSDVWRLTVGGRNIFDEYPDEAEKAAPGSNDYCCGRIYSSNTIVPWQGGYYFLRLDATF